MAGWANVYTFAVAYSPRGSTQKAGRRGVVGRPDQRAQHAKNADAGASGLEAR